VVNIEKGIAALRKIRGKKKSARFWNGDSGTICSYTGRTNHDFKSKKMLV
jgi:hypothetical protein